MRNITKVFLFLIAALVVYVVWPRTPNLKGFDPNEIARLSVEDWKAQQAGKAFPGLVARYKIYTTQFNLSPLTAYRMAQSQAAGVEELKRLHAENAEGGGDDSKAVSFLTEKYAMVKIAATAGSEADALARFEVAWISLILSGAPADQIAEPISQILAAEYGGAPEDFKDASANLAYAQWMIFAGQPSPDGQSALDYAREGYKLLKEIANTVPTPAAPQS